MKTIEIIKLEKRGYSEGFVSFLSQHDTTRNWLGFEDFRDILLKIHPCAPARCVIWDLIDETIETFEQANSLLSGTVVNFEWAKVIKMLIRMSKTSEHREYVKAYLSSKGKEHQSNCNNLLILSQKVSI